MAGFPIEKILVEGNADQYGLSRRIQEKMPDIPRVTNSGKPDGSAPYSLDRGKKTLHLLEYSGELLKPCPGTTNHICCGYQILNVATNCPLDCSYCILQSYFNEPDLRVFINIKERIEEVLHLIDSHPDKIFRIGTGEFTDSLALDPLVGWADMLVPLFAKRKNAILELKPKPPIIDRLLNCPSVIRSLFRGLLTAQPSPPRKSTRLRASARDSKPHGDVNPRVLSSVFTLIRLYPIPAGRRITPGPSIYWTDLLILPASSG